MPRAAGQPLPGGTPEPASRHGPAPTLGTLVAALLATAAACSGEVELVDPTESPTPGLERATLAVVVQIHPQDSAVARAIGWPDALIPQAEVTLQRQGSTEELTAATDSSGAVSFERLLAGSYRVSAVRILTEEERALLPEAEADVNALGGGATVSVSAPATDLSLWLAAGRPGSLVISEWSFLSVPYDGGASWYDFGGYLELYNNTDTTIYLDRKLIGSGVRGAWDYSSSPCAEFEKWRNDAEGLWIFFLYQFQGSGRQFPLRAGHHTLIATDAIDHRPYAPDAIDLSSADFEFEGSADVDNPTVPNIVTVGPREYFRGHGLRFISLDDIVVVADPVDLSTLPVDHTPAGVEIWRLPAENIIDVHTYRTTWTPSNPPCERMVHERFDRQEARMLGDLDYLLSAQRRVLFTTPEGRKVLQNTRTSSRDFRALARSPGLIP